MLYIVFLLLASPAQAAPAGPVTVVVATCRESVAIWRDVPEGVTLDNSSRIAGAIYISIHGHEFPVEMYWQYRWTGPNGRANFQAINWQMYSLQSESIRIGRGWIEIDGVIPGQELEQVGTVFEMDCRHVYMPAVIR